MKKADQTWLIVALMLLTAFFVNILSTERSHDAELIAFFTKVVDRMLLVVGGMMLLGWMRYQDDALRISTLLLTMLIFLIAMAIFVDLSW